MIRSDAAHDDGLAPLNIGICCYPTLGGSGVVATELGLELAERGHSVYVVSYDRPRRLRQHERVHFHHVVVPDYPVFHHAPYALALASKLVEVATWQRLDILHAHYALPHATSAFLACEILQDARPKLITTIHGTDVTLVGRDDSYRPITRFSLQKSDAITSPSDWLAETAQQQIGLDASKPIEVINNFVDTRVLRPTADDPAAQLKRRRRRARLFAKDKTDAPIIAHVSNFRPIKRTLDVVEIFAAVVARRPARLLLIGDGPERSRTESRIRELGLGDHVHCAGQVDHVHELLPLADLLLLPSELESFGLVALEAAACCVPTVASAVGGLGEVIADGETGLLIAVGDVPAFAQAVVELLGAPVRLAAMGRAARTRAETSFDVGPTVDRYEALYRRVLAKPWPTTCP